MTHEIEFSIMADSPAVIQSLLDQFEAEHDIRVRLRLLSWDTAWSDLIKTALYSDGPDISEIGSTWLGDLVAMNALRPFSPEDVAEFGGPAVFSTPAWRGTRLVDQPETWAIPWLTGARLIFFRRSLLTRAGVDLHTAFQTPEHVDQTLDRLAASGVTVPWTVPTGLTHTTLLNVASWVWAAGGDFVAADGKRTLFSQPEARAGLRAYFALGRFLVPAVRRLTGIQPDDQFLQDTNTAMTLSGPWLFRRATPELMADLGVALPPGASFVGGSHLVIWKHTHQPEAAQQLIRFLVQTPAQVVYSQRMGLLPAQLAALAEPPFAAGALWPLAIQGLKAGRSFAVTRSWGLMEDRLTRALHALWADVLADPGLDLDPAITRHLEPLATRLDLVLGQS